MSTSIQALTLDLEKDGWEASRGFVKRDVPYPELDEHANPMEATFVVLKMRYAGVCGSDRGIWKRQAFSDMIRNSLQKESKSLRILGHEFLGEVIAAGSQVGYLYGIKVGDMVTGDSHVTCGKCLQCRIGMQEACQDQLILGISIDGVFAEYVKLPAKNLWRVDTSMVRPEVCAIYDPIGNAVHALTPLELRGATIAVFGCGQIGLFSIALARRYGASLIIGIDTNAKQLEMAKALGAHHIVKIENKGKPYDYEADTEAVEAIKDITKGKGVNIAMEMAGFNSSVNNCLEVVRPGGHVVFFGIKDGDFTITNFSRTVVKGVTIHNIIGRQIFKTWHTMHRLLSDASNGLQDDIWNIILRSGNGTIIPLSAFTPELMEAKMNEHPKLIFDMEK
ncbi:MAG: alcohol dehydrogenase catalytic domain-containing protein [Patescibacteria group bacterium]